MIPGEEARQIIDEGLTARGWERAVHDAIALRVAPGITASGVGAPSRFITRYLLRSRHLREAILKRVFEGKVVPQCPNDERACALLDRIKQARGAKTGNGGRA